MLDTVVNGTRTSRSILGNLSIPDDPAEAIALLKSSGWPIDLGPLNDAGLSQRGTDLNKANLLSDETAALYGFEGDAATVDMVLKTNFLGVPGLAWNYAKLPSSNGGGKIAYGDGKFVAIGTPNFYYSNNGIDWRNSYIPSSVNNIDWRDIAFGGGRFVAVGVNTDKAIYSDDGINWNLITLPKYGGFYGISYGNGLFVALSADYAFYSNDGINWTQTPLPASGGWTGIAYGDGKFVAATYLGDNAAYSSDGIVWGHATMPSSAPWNSIAYGGGRFVAVSGGSASSDKSAYSDDGGKTWTEVKLPKSNEWTQISYGNGRFVVVGKLTGASSVATSTDGVNWYLGYIDKDQYWNGLSYGKGMFVAVASSSNAAAFSGNMNSGQTYTETQILGQQLTDLELLLREHISSQSV